MNVLEFVGAITLSLIGIVLLWGIYRLIFPKKYTWKNCPRDHDTMARYGSLNCTTCGEEFYLTKEDE